MFLMTIARRDGSAAAQSKAFSRARSPDNTGADDDVLMATYEDVAAAYDEVLKSIGEFDEFRAFCADCYDSQSSAEWAKKKGTKSPKNNLEKRGKIFRIEKADSKFADGMRQTRCKECNNIISFKAVRVLSREKAQALIAQGVGCIPMQWIDIDKNKHLMKPGGPYVPPLHKARLVARGDLEKGFSQTDSFSVYF